MTSSPLVPSAFGLDFDFPPLLPINATQLGSLGVGDLSSDTGALNTDGGDCGSPEETCVLDNRHLNMPLQQILCAEEDGGAREYMDALIGLAWPSNAELWLCCSEEYLSADPTSSPCLEPDFRFAVGNTQEEELGLAPHFLTVLFVPEQQEVLTAALIAKFNTHGTKLHMELAGILDLGELAGTRFVPREFLEDFPYELGQAWGNLFLDCLGTDADHVLCQASVEADREIGRDPIYQQFAMFSCSNQDNNPEDYPVEEMGKSCFSADMESNNQDGCGLVAAVGTCERVCVAGFCGVNQPPVEGRGTTNVLYIYMGEPPEDNEGDRLALKIALPIAAAVLLVLIAAVCFQAKKRNKVNKGTSEVAPQVTMEEPKVAKDDDEGTDIIGEAL